MATDADRVESCARSPFRNVRLYALEKIAQERHPKASGLVLSLLRDPDSAVQLEAVRTAGILQCREAAPILVDLLNSAEESVALQAAVSLGELGHHGELTRETQSDHEPASPQADSSPEPMSELTFYLLFFVLSAGLFMSGYLYHAEMSDPSDGEHAPPQGAGLASSSR